MTHDTRTLALAEWSVSTFTFASLFTGIAGLDLGLERAGMRCAAQCEIDPKASAVLAYHYPKTSRFGDVRHVGKHNLKTVNLICGGFPCQDVSITGSRAGLAGKRSGLWFEFLRILTELAPRWVVIENVPGLLSSNKGRDFATVIHGLVECGYRIAWRVLDAQYFGVPQNRDRVFIVGHLGSGRAAEVLFEADAEFFEAIPKRLVSPALIANGQVDNSGGKWAGGIVIQDPRGYRRLTPIECERLQGFPDNWTAVCSHSDGMRYKQLGNAVCVNVAEWLGRRIMEAEKSA